MNVLFPTYYDLTMKAYRGELLPGVYRIDFLEYVKAGVAFNTRGRDGEHTIDFYAKLLYALEGEVEEEATLLNAGLKLFYNDLIYLYSRLVTAKYKQVGDVSKTAGEVKLVSSFEKVPRLLTVFEAKRIVLGTDADLSILPGYLIAQAPALCLLKETPAGCLIRAYVDQTLNHAKAQHLLEVTL